jgi:hypothetical protein
LQTAAGTRTCFLVSEGARTRSASPDAEPPSQAGIHPCGNRERQQACETYDPQKSGPRPMAAPRKAAGRGNATISRLYVEPRTRRRRQHTPAIAASCPPRRQSGWHRRACRIRDPGSCVENPLAGSQNFSADASPRSIDRGSSNAAENFLSGIVHIRIRATRWYSSVLRSPQSR